MHHRLQPHAPRLQPHAPTLQPCAPPGTLQPCAPGLWSGCNQAATRLQPYVPQEESELASVLLAEVQSEVERTAAAAPGFPLFAEEESEAATAAAAAAAAAAAPTAAPAPAFKRPATIAGELPTPTLTLARTLTPTPPTLAQFLS